MTTTTIETTGDSGSGTFLQRFLRERLLQRLSMLTTGALRFEIMIETTQSIFAEDGSVSLPRMVAEGRNRLVAAHFGTYDYTAACGITAAHQQMLHPACDFARHVMQVALAGTGIWLEASTALHNAVHFNQGSGILAVAGLLIGNTPAAFSEE